MRCAFLVSAVLTVTLTGCDRAEVVEPRPGVQVRMLDSGSGGEVWWRQAEDVLEHLETEFGAAVSRASLKSTGARRDALSASGEDEVDLVVCVGPSWETEVLAAAQSFPATAFLLSPGTVTAQNVAVLDFQPFGAAYVGGVVAASEGGNRVGIVTGDGSQWLDVITAGFTEGFRSRFRSGKIIIDRGPGGVSRMSDESVGVALYAADQIDAEVLHEAQRNGVKLVGIGRTTMVESPDVVVAALTVDLPEAIDRIMRDVLDGTFRGRIYSFDLGSGVVDLSMSLDLQRGLPDDDLERVAEARAAVTAGLVELEQMGF